MIARLKGEILQQDGERLVIDVGGVGYEVSASAAVFSSLLPAAESNAVSGQGPVELIIYTEVRETAISLYGFANQLERQVFLLLQRVKGIGSKLALAIISAMGAEEVLGLIGSGDLRALQRIPGVGKKTAERIIVELREQVGELVAGTSALSKQIEKSRIAAKTGSNLDLNTPQTDALLALEKLGFAAERAEPAVKSALEEMTAAGQLLDAGAILQLALTKISQ